MKTSISIFKFFKIAICVSVLIFIVYISPLAYFHLKYYTKNPANPEQINVAIVFGASVLANKEPSVILKDRLDKAIQMYEDKDVKYIFVTGDNRNNNYNEPKVMQDYLVSKGIPQSAIYYDYAGLRTNDSCWRAKNIYKIDKAYLVTQHFHMPRALFLCNSFGIESYKATAYNKTNKINFNSWWRETQASWLAILDSRKPSATVGSYGNELIIPKQ